MNARFLLVCAIAGSLVSAMSCAPTVVTFLPPSVRQVVVLPPYRRDVVTEEPRDIADGNLVGLSNMTVGDVLAQQARARLEEKGFQVIPPSLVKLATKDRIPATPQMAAAMVRDGNLDAAAMYIEVRRWAPTPNDRGMKADGVIVALEVVLVDSKTGAVLWQVHYSSRPVPVYGVVLTSQANIIVAETVMREIFTQLGSRRPAA